jgi:hypothetical protein
MLLLWIDREKLKVNDFAEADGPEVVTAAKNYERRIKINVRARERALLVTLMNVSAFVQRSLSFKWKLGSGHGGVLSKWVIPEDNIMDNFKKMILIYHTF